MKKFADQGVDANTFEGLVRIVFLGWNRNPYKTSTDGHGRIVVENDFDAGYGWNGVMMDVFWALSPYLADNSSLEIAPDKGKEYFVIKNGKVVAK